MKQRLTSIIAVITVVTASWLISSYAQKTGPVAVKEPPVLPAAENRIQPAEEKTQPEENRDIKIAMSSDSPKEMSSAAKTEPNPVAEEPQPNQKPQPDPEPQSNQEPQPDPEPQPASEPKPNQEPKLNPEPDAPTVDTQPIVDKGSEPEPVKKDPSSRDGSEQSKAEKVLSIAYSLEGTPYVRGGSTPKGFDCSGFTCYVFRLGAGVSLPRTSSAQATVGKAVSKDNLEPGDIVYFNTNGRSVSHVGVYVGNNSFIHASYTKGITVTSLSNSYYIPRYLGARRIL